MACERGRASTGAQSWLSGGDASIEPSEAHIHPVLCPLGRRGPSLRCLPVPRSHMACSSVLPACAAAPGASQGGAVVRPDVLIPPPEHRAVPLLRFVCPSSSVYGLSECLPGPVGTERAVMEKPFPEAGGPCTGLGVGWGGLRGCPGPSGNGRV